MDKIKLGIFGSSAGDMSLAEAATKELADIVAKNPQKYIVITGACKGLPYIFAETVNQSGVEVWGYAPYTNKSDFISENKDQDTSIYTKLIFLPDNLVGIEEKRTRLKYRNVTSTAIADAGIIISGRWGSLNEFTNLVDQQKITGVLTGTGGVADQLLGLSQKIIKQGQGKIIFESDPKKLLESVTSAITDKS